MFNIYKMLYLLSKKVRIDEITQDQDQIPRIWQKNPPLPNEIS